MTFIYKFESKKLFFDKMNLFQYFNLNDAESKHLKIECHNY